MRIAFLTREYPPDTAWGGVATVYHNLARVLSEQGHEIHVICQAVGKPKDYIEQGVFVHRVGINPKQNSAIARTNYSLHAWRKLKKLIETRGIEIVGASFTGAEGFFCSLFSGLPLVVSAHTTAQGLLQTKTYSGTKSFLSLKLLSVLEHFTAKRASKVVANSQAMYSRLTSEVHIAADKIDIVHHAIDTIKFNFVASDIRQRVGIPDGAPVALSIGRLEARKSPHILCQVIPRIIESKPDAKFVFLGRDTNTAPGGGSFKQYIIHKAQGGGFLSNLVFIDFLPEDELVQLYSACDVFVSASLQESFGLTPIEAMACGKPVVATPVGIVPELQPYGLKGLSVTPVGDDQRLAEAVLNFLALGDNDRNQIAKENRQLIEDKFCLAGWADKMSHVYGRAMRMRRNHG